MVKVDDAGSQRWTNAVEVHGHFVTTTVRGWAPIFRREAIREAVAACLIDDCMFYNARLMAFAIMTHHVHFIAYRPVDHTISWFLDRFKSNTSKRILPILMPAEIEMLRHAPPDHGNLIWKRSFRGIPLTTESVRQRKNSYIHRNPVRAGFSEHPANYRWSKLQLD